MELYIPFLICLHGMVLSGYGFMPWYLDKPRDKFTLTLPNTNVKERINCK